MRDIRKICVIGLGYIGLPTSAIMASNGVRVVGVDIEPSIVDSVNAGRAHFLEADLDELLGKVIADGSLTASQCPEPADAFVIAVPTPLTGDKSADLSSVVSAIDQIIPVLEPGNLVILESTVTPGTTQKMAQRISKGRSDLNEAGGVGRAFHMAHCPERVLPGRILTELVQNDRIIGGITPDCSAMAAALYKRFVRGECIETTAATAELTKLVENSFRDVNIAFANELSLICDKLDIDVWELIALANRHPRVSILNPGPGVGGHCLAVDPWFIVEAAQAESRLIRTAREVNDSKPDWVVQKVKAAAEATGKERPVIACFGLSYKANVGDLRESPALAIAKQLAQKEIGDIKAVEPNIDVLPKSAKNCGVELIDLPTALALADLFVLLVGHAQFSQISLSLSTSRCTLDFRGPQSLR